MTRKKVFVALAVAFAAVMLFAVTAYARYMDQTGAGLSFQVKGLPELEMATQTWEKVGENTYTLIFTMENDADSCVLFLAVSQGVSVPEQIQVYLSLENDQILRATGTQIQPNSDLANVFGEGYVFRFLDAETGEECILDLEAGREYALNVVGLDSAAEQTSLLRVFIEYAQ